MESWRRCARTPWRSSKGCIAAPASTRQSLIVPLGGDHSVGRHGGALGSGCPSVMSRLDHGRGCGHDDCHVSAAWLFVSLDCHAWSHSLGNLILLCCPDQRNRCTMLVKDRQMEHTRDFDSPNHNCRHPSYCLCCQIAEVTNTCTT